MQENQEQLQPSNQAKNKSLFVVSSAIHAKHGVYSTQERLQQTIATLESIRERVSCDIIVLDGGSEHLTEDERKELNDHVDIFYSFVDEESVKEVQKSPSWDIVKNLIEIIMFGSFFQSKQNDLREYDRIFKMSGRYILNDNFNYNLHLNAKDKIVIRGPYTSQFSSELTGGVSLQYMSRLWSFDSSLLPYVSNAYHDMFNHMMQRLTNNGYIDIEHLLFHHLEKDLIINPSIMGIQGNIAPNGVLISE